MLYSFLHSDHYFVLMCHENFDKKKSFKFVIVK